MKAIILFNLKSLLLIGLLVWAVPAKAIPLKVYNQIVQDSRKASAHGQKTAEEEDDDIDVAQMMYFNENGTLPPGVPAVGQPRLDGVFPVAHLADGANSLLSFGFIDPSTLLPVTNIPIGSVIYDVNVDPDTPQDFLPIGTSFDAATNFSLPYTLSGFEPFVRATPTDPSGNPIIIPGVDGDNVAVGFVTNISIVPEPASILLLATGLAGVVIEMKRGQEMKSRGKGVGIAGEKGSELFWQGKRGQNWAGEKGSELF